MAGGITYHREDFFKKLASQISGLPVDLAAKREQYKFEPWTFISEQCETITDIDPPNGIYRSCPLVLFNAQENLIRDIVSFAPDGSDFYIDDSHEEKSRQMGMSWILADLGLWAIEFWPHIAGLYLSRKEEEVDDGGARSTRDSIFGKIRYAYEHQEDWLKAYAPVEFKFLQINNPAMDSFLVGESANPNAGRGGTYKFAVCDEWAFVPNSEAVAMAVDQACKRGKILNSTPHGTGNHYARIKRMHSRGVDTGYKFHRLHWSQNPKYAKGLTVNEKTGQLTSPWYEKITRTMTREAVARELEMSYTSSMSGLVYPEFNIDLDAPGTVQFDAEVDYSIKKGPVYCGWDWGLNDPTCFLLMQKNEIGGYDVFYEMSEDGQPIENFVPYIRELQRNYPSDWVFFGDIAGIQREKITGSSVIEELARHGIQVQYKKQAVQDGISLIRVMHQNRQIRVHSRCLMYIECKTNYHYPLAPDGQPREGIEIPYHDWSSHLMDAERYCAMGVFEGAEIDPDDFIQDPGDDWLGSEIDVETMFGGIL